MNKLKEFIEKSRKVHNDKYDYSLVQYINSRTKVKIICPIHGEFIQNANSHIQKRGCPDCGKVKNRELRKSNNKEFIEKCKKVHGDKYNYSNIA